MLHSLLKVCPQPPRSCFRVRAARPVGSGCTYLVWPSTSSPVPSRAAPTATTTGPTRYQVGVAGLLGSPGLFGGWAGRTEEPGRWGCGVCISRAGTTRAEGSAVSGALFAVQRLLELTRESREGSLLAAPLGGAWSPLPPVLTGGWRVAVSTVRTGSRHVLCHCERAVVRSVFLVFRVQKSSTPRRRGGLHSPSQTESPCGPGSTSRVPQARLDDPMPQGSHEPPPWSFIFPH